MTKYDTPTWYLRIRLGTLVLFLTLMSAVSVYAQQARPDPVMTPGAINEEITQDNIKDNICNHGGWSTKSIRPKVGYTNKLKKSQIVEYKYKDTDPRSYEEDHLISLELGGNPTDPRNLWPQPWYKDGSNKCGAKRKDTLENTLHKKVCSGELTLLEAQYAIASDWVQAYNDYVGPLSCE